MEKPAPSSGFVSLPSSPMSQANQPKFLPTLDPRRFATIGVGCEVFHRDLRTAARDFGCLHELVQGQPELASVC